MTLARNQAQDTICAVADVVAGELRTLGRRDLADQLKELAWGGPLGRADPDVLALYRLVLYTARATHLLASVSAKVVDA